RAISAEFHHDSGEQHRARGGRGDVTSRRPGVERPNAGEDREYEKQNWERPRLEWCIELKLRELIQIERTSAAVDRDDSEKNEGAAKKRIERQFHRAVFLVRRTEDRDQEIFRDDDELVEKKEEKQIGAEEDAVGTAHHQQEPEEKLFRPIFDIPGK